MKKYCKALVNLGVAFIILLLIVFLVPKLLVFFAPFVAGWIIALIASPLVRFFEEKVKIKRKAGSAFVIVAVIALVILILYLVGAKLTDEIMGLIGALPDIWDSAENDFADIGQMYHINKMLQAHKIRTEQPLCRDEVLKSHENSHHGNVAE